MPGESGARYVRYEAAEPGRRGTHPGLFALANSLARAGRLSSEDRAWWRAANDWYEANCPNPARADPSLFDRGRHPFASCWFKVDAEAMLERVPGYLELLDRYGVSWRVLHTADPGRILYEDDVQVVIAPYAREPSHHP